MLLLLTNALRHFLKSIYFCKAMRVPTHTHTHLNLHIVCMISYIHDVTTGSFHNDPLCSADTEQLPTRNPRKDYLAQTFISSPLLCLLCSHCSIPDDLLFFAHEQVSICVIRLGSAVRLAVKPNGTATPVCRLHE